MGEDRRRCAGCGQALGDGDRFCTRCGREVTGGGGGPLTGGITGDLFRRLQSMLSATHEIERPLGRGGMSYVYLAHERLLQRPVAIKLLAPQLAEDLSVVDRFLREARTQARLNHPNIVNIHAVSQGGDDQLPYIIMEYMPGRTLSQVLRAASAPLDVGVILTWLTQVGTALDYAHSQNVVHRDIKPGNILFDRQGNAHVADFGIAKLESMPRLTQVGMVLGTPTYMSPEQIDGTRDVDPASDQYSLGVVAYEMFAGAPPFEGNAIALCRAHLEQIPEPLQVANSSVTEKVASAVVRMLSKDPAERFPTIGDALAVMGGHLPGPGDPQVRVMADLTTHPSEIRIDADPEVTLRTGDRIALEAVAWGASGRPLQHRQIEWVTGDPTIVEVTPDGFLVGVAEGTVNVTASCEGVQAVRTITVVKPGEAQDVPAWELPTPTPPPTPDWEGAIHVPAHETDPGFQPVASPATPARDDGPEPEPAPQAEAGPAPSSAGAAEPIHGRSPGRKRGWLIVSALLVVAVVAFFLTKPLFSGGGPAVGTLLIEGNLPVGARLWLTGSTGESDVSPGTLDLAEGEYVLHALAAGFEPFEFPFTMSGGGEAHVPLRMTPLPPKPEAERATLIVDRSGLPAAATVSLVGADSTIPIRSADPIDVPVGNYTLRAEADGFETSTEPVNLVAGAVVVRAPHLSRTAEPSPPVERFGRLVLRGNAPAAATVTIRGSNQTWSVAAGGSRDLPPGTYTIEATAVDYTMYTGTVTIQADEDTQVAVNMTPVEKPAPPPADGSIDITGSLPPGASLQLTGPDGSRPVAVGTVSVRAGSYTLVVSAPGRETQRVPIAVAAGATVRASIPTLPIAEAARTAALGLVDAVVRRFNSRDATVADLIVGSMKDNTRQLLTNRSNVPDLSATLVSREDPVLAGSMIDVRFRMKLSFESHNQRLESQYLMVLHSEEQSGQWMARSLEILEVSH